MQSVHQSVHDYYHQSISLNDLFQLTQPTDFAVGMN